MKRFFCFSIAILIFLFSFINAYSINIDGYDDGAEWIKAEKLIVFDGESNCKVNFGLVKWIFEPEINVINLCFVFKEPGLSRENTNIGVSLQIENSDFYTFTVDNNPEEYDVDKYFLDGAVIANETQGAIAEIRLGIKHGLPDVINFKVRFIDSSGSPSNVYDFSIKNTCTTTYKSDYNYAYNGEENNPSSKTTKQTTEKTTVKQTTKISKENEEDNDYFIWNLLFGQTTTKTTEKPKETKPAEKTRKKSSEKSTTYKMKSTQTETISASEAVPSTTETVNIQTDFNTNSSKSEKYKTIMLIAGGLSIVAISVLGTLKSKKDNNNENDRNS